MKNTDRLFFFKHIAYSAMLLLLYILQTVPGLFAIRGVKPILVIPFAVIIAMLEGEFVGGIYGASAGLLCDVSGFLLFGFNAFIITVCCIVAGLLIIYLMRCNLLTCLLFVFVTLMLRGWLEYFFAYGMWSYENAGWIFTHQTFPSILYSTAITPLAFFAVRGARRRFALYEDEKL